MIKNILLGMELKREKMKYEIKALKSAENVTMFKDGGASQTKKTFRNWWTRWKTSDEDILESKELLMARSLFLYKNTPLGAGIIKKIVTNVVGPGLKIKSTMNGDFLGVSEKEKELLELQVETLWEMWAESTQCDFKKRSNFYELQAAFVSSWLIGGEGVAILPIDPRKGEYFDLRIDLVEGNRLHTPLRKGKKNIVNGVEYSENGVLKAYHFRTKIGFLYKYTRIEAFGRKTGRNNVLFLMDQQRAEQRVGLPLLTPVIQELKQLGDWQKSEIESAITSAIYAYFITKKTGANTSIKPRDDEFTSTTPTEQGKSEVITRFVEPGSINELEEGQEVVAPPTGRSVASYDVFLTTICKTIGAAVEMPYEVLLSAFNSNYSASRAALLEVWKMYNNRRTKVIDKFCKPIYEEFMDEIVAKGYVNIPNYFTDPLVRKAALRAEWYGPVQGSIDPKKEAQADELNIKNKTKSRARITRENGNDWDQTVEQLAKEERKIKEVFDAGE